MTRSYSSWTEQTHEIITTATKTRISEYYISSRSGKHGRLDNVIEQEKCHVVAH